jgi:pyruvate carboxylase
VFFELNGQPREVRVRDKSVRAVASERAKADPSDSKQVGAPIPGVVASIAVERGQRVGKGEKLLVMEAMKMQSTVYAPVAGKIAVIAAHVGEHVEAKDLLVTIE